VLFFVFPLLLTIYFWKWNFCLLNLFVVYWYIIFILILNLFSVFFLKVIKFWFSQYISYWMIYKNISPWPYKADSSNHWCLLFTKCIFLCFTVL
jgi:hypothetical protein